MSDANTVNWCLEILKLVPSTVIGGIVAYVAYQQWKTNDHKVKMDLYDRRFKVYDQVRKIIEIVLQDMTLSIKDIHKFKTSTSDAEFLFGPEIQKYLDEIAEHGLKLHRSTQELENPALRAQDYDHQRVCDEKYEEGRWFIDQSELFKGEFKKYLDINK